MGLSLPEVDPSCAVAREDEPDAAAMWILKVGRRVWSRPMGWKALCLDERVWKIHLLWQVLIKLPCIGKDKESESHDVHRRTEGAGMVHFLGAVSRFHVKPRRVAEGPFSY